MRVDLHSAFVLHQRSYRETSLLLEVFSLRSGRVGLIAKGANRQRSAFRGALQFFRPLLLAWAGRGELSTLVGAEVDGPFSALSGRALLSAFYLNELLMRVLHRDDPHPALFAAYRQALESLAQAGNEEPALRLFEKRLLEDIGYGLSLSFDVDTNAPIEPERDYYYQSDRGPWRDPPTHIDTVKVKGRTLIALAAALFHEPEALSESKRLMRFILASHIGGRPLASRQLFS